MKDMLISDHNIDWEKLTTCQKWGTGVYREEIGDRSMWIGGWDLPKFTEARAYFDEYLQEPIYPGELKVTAPS